MLRLHFVMCVHLFIIGMSNVSIVQAADPIQIELETVATGLISPVDVTHANDGSGRLFVVDQAGFIWIIDGGVLLPVPFLDIATKLPVLGTFFDERGLLGVAFHPDYANNGRFFVRYSSPRAGDPNEPCNNPEGFIVGCHSEVLAEYAVSVGDPNLADAASEVILFSVDEPEFNHDAGDVAFGPDGYLYFGLGDGGGAHDGLDLESLPHGEIGNGQNIETALGSVIRIDVDSTPALGLNYAIPPDNPFVGSLGLDEIYAYGLRNPYRFSFDDGPGGNGALYLGDVGQAIFEEVDIIVNGGNYGWVIREGANCFDPFAPDTPPAVCPTTGTVLNDPLIDPINEYTHADGGLSVIGGFVYRGSQSPELFGKYIYGDFSADFGPTGRIYYFDLDGPDVFVRKEFLLAPGGDPLDQFVKGFGEDGDGEVYVLASDILAPNGDAGIVYRIVSIPTGACCTFGSCIVATQVDCESSNGTYRGDRLACLGDSDGDGFDGRCESCPNDSSKTSPGICGCNVFENVGDNDSDGVVNCRDNCPNDVNVDQADSDRDGVGDACSVQLPAVSEWGMVILILLLLITSKIYFEYYRGALKA